MFIMMFIVTINHYVGDGSLVQDRDYGKIDVYGS